MAWSHIKATFPAPCIAQCQQSGSANGTHTHRIWTYIPYLQHQNLYTESKRTRVLPGSLPVSHTMQNTICLSCHVLPELDKLC